MSAALHTCPRRNEVWSRDYLRNREQDKLDSWRPARGGAGLGTTVSTCSYCSSMHPDEFMEGLRVRTLLVGPTDKNYKAYVLRSTGDHVAKFYYQHFSNDQMTEFVDLYNQRNDEGDRFMLVGYPGHLYRLPFFMVAGAKVS